MNSTVEPQQALTLLAAVHSNPADVLGMHVRPLGDTETVVVRAFLPHAADLEVVDKICPEIRYPARRMHQDGLFEAVCQERPCCFPYLLRITNYSQHVQLIDDPYAYPIQLSDYDRYLFNQSTHYHIYQKMGAQCVRYGEIDGVRFVVWAPNAKRVSVVGDFNRWDGRAHPMNSHGDSGLWELFVPGISEGELYKFELKTHDQKILMKSDPYGRHFEVRPRDASIVCHRDIHDWHDADWINERESTQWHERPILIYEVHVGSWRRKPEEGNRCLTYRELADELVPYVVQMGYTHIELMAILEHLLDESWGYQVIGYFAPTSRYGTPDDFKYLVDCCHQQNLGVILDWVPGHFPKDAVGLSEFDGTALYEHDDDRRGEHPDWGTKIFNYGRHEVKNFLISNALFWFDEYHIDGFRVDAVASMLYLNYSRLDNEWVPNVHGGHEDLEAIEFIKHLNSVVYQYFPGILMIAEESTAWPGVSRPCDENGLGFGFKWNMGWMHDTLGYFQRDPIYRKHHHDDLTFTTLYAHAENFILPLSHDEVVHGKGSLIARMPGDYWQQFANLRLLYTLMYAFPGKVLKFMGCEFGQFAEWNPKQSLDWHLLEYESHRGIQRLVSDLNHLTRQCPPLFARDYDPEGFQWINGADAENSVWAFIRWGQGERNCVVVVLNFTPATREHYRIGVPVAGEYRELFNSDHTCYGGGGTTIGKVHATSQEWHGFSHSLTITLPPLGGVLLVPHDRPDG